MQFLRPAQVNQQKSACCIASIPLILQEIDSKLILMVWDFMLAGVVEHGHLAFVVATVFPDNFCWNSTSEHVRYYPFGRSRAAGEHVQH